MRASTETWNHDAFGRLGSSYRSNSTSDGEEALRVFEQHSDDIDLALLD